MADDIYMDASEDIRGLPGTLAGNEYVGTGREWVRPEDCSAWTAACDGGNLVLAGIDVANCLCVEDVLGGKFIPQDIQCVLADIQYCDTSAHTINGTVTLSFDIFSGKWGYTDGTTTWELTRPDNGHWLLTVIGASSFFYGDVAATDCLPNALEIANQQTDADPDCPDDTDYGCGGTATLTML